MLYRGVNKGLYVKREGLLWKIIINENFLQDYL